MPGFLGGGGEGGRVGSYFVTLCIFGSGCATGTLKPLPFTRPRSADFFQPTGVF